jgi:phosphatidylinositol alpha-mannosyltransferase
MRIGIVCPYSLDVPGGVQLHVRDLAEHLLGTGHQVSVLAPADDDTPVAPYVVAAGRAVPVPYNGSVARLTFGPLSAARVRRWLGDGSFDVLHVHEPTTPSLSILACWAASGPSSAPSTPRSCARGRCRPPTDPVPRAGEDQRPGRRERGGAPDPRRAPRGDAVVIPNGVYVDRFAAAQPRPEWRGEAGTLGFVGRIDEPRKGLAVLLKGVRAPGCRRPGVGLLVAGRGDAQEAAEQVSPQVRDAVTFLGQVSDEGKMQLLRSVDAYVAPNLGGESFGIVLVEAMSAGAPVVASDIEAFRKVLDDGRGGVLVPVDDAHALADALLALLEDPARRHALSGAGAAMARQYDWSTVAGRRARGLRDGGRRRRTRAGGPWRRLGGGADERLAGTGVGRRAARRPLLMVAWNLSWTAGRLDRLHGRVEGSWAALDAQLVRRASVTAELATSGLLDPATSVLLAAAAHEARESGREERELAESNLSAALRAAFDEEEAAELLAADAHGRTLLVELSSACQRVQLARRFHNGAVRSAQVVRASGPCGGCASPVTPSPRTRSRWTTRPPKPSTAQAARQPPLIWAHAHPLRPRCRLPAGRRPSRHGGLLVKRRPTGRCARHRHRDREPDCDLVSAAPVADGSAEAAADVAVHRAPHRGSRGRPRGRGEDRQHQRRPPGHRPGCR